VSTVAREFWMNSWAALRAGRRPPRWGRGGVIWARTRRSTDVEQGKRKLVGGWWMHGSPSACASRPGVGRWATWIMRAPLWVTLARFFSYPILRIHTSAHLNTYLDMYIARHRPLRIFYLFMFLIVINTSVARVVRHLAGLLLLSFPYNFRPVSYFTIPC
jgi:hypothetical protein